jgi:hypothetical protein
VEFAQLLMPPTKSQRTGGDVAARDEESDLDKSVFEAPFAGLKFLTKGEATAITIDREKSSNFMLSARSKVSTNIQLLVESMASKAQVEVLDSLSNDFTENALVYWPSRDACLVDLEQAFGGHAPHQYRSLGELSSDAAISTIFFNGCGASYVRPTNAAPHAVPEGAAFEVNFEDLYKYETRAPFVRYGATGYFANAVGKLPDLIAIWHCDTQALVRPTDAGWRHARAVLKASLGTHLTLRDHLAQLHWTYANGLDIAARTTLNQDHFLRRLLRPHYYNTSAINILSKDMLIPVCAFGHRTFGFTADSWLRYFNNVLDEFTWTSFPDTLDTSGLSPEFLEQWPYAIDGLRVWEAINKYVKGVLGQFLTSEEVLHADPEIVAFWGAFTDGSIKTKPWTLPPLTLSNLFTLVTDLIWRVTAAHQLIGSIVEYVNTPDGIPCKLVLDAELADVQSVTQAMALVTLTGHENPLLMDDYRHVLTFEGWGDTNQAKVLEHVMQFQEDLAAIAAAIDNDNVDRQRVWGHTFMSFNPRCLEVSVSK